MLQFHKSQENHLVTECYHKHLGEVGGHRAHELLHTEYHSRRRISGERLVLLGSQFKRLRVNVCLGTSCLVRGAQTLLKLLADYVQQQGLEDCVEVQATFCFEQCDQGPTVCVGDKAIHHCTFQKACEAIQEELAHVMS
jgi:NADH-quinone oxidoreductase subunit G